MAHLRPQFEKELLNRVRLKSTQHVSEEQVLVKCFRYYDLNNSGTITRDQFVQVVEKLGMLILSKELFAFYSENDQLNYRKFIQLLYANMTASSRRFSPLKDQLYSYSYAKPAQPQDYMFRLQKRVAQGPPDILLQLAQALMDKSDAEVRIEDFDAIVSSLIPGTSQEEIKKVFNYFDKKLNNRIRYDDFLMTLRGVISYQIQEALGRIFAQLSRGNPNVDIDLLLDTFNEKAFNTRGHSQLERLKDNLRVYLQYRQIENRQLSAKQFEEFNFMSNFPVSNESSFIQLMQQAWPAGSSKQRQPLTPNSQNSLRKQYSQANFPPNSNTTPVKKLIFLDQSDKQEYPPPPPAPQVSETLYRLRSLLTKRGPKAFINFHRQMKIMDDDADRALSLEQFKRVFMDYKVDLNETQIIDIFRSLEENGRLKIDVFNAEVLGNFDEDCRELVERVFDGIDRDCDGIILIQELKSIFAPRYHPDAKQGKRSETEILAEFLDAYEAHHALYAGMRDPRVTKRELFDYYHILFTSINNPLQFQNILKGCFFQVLNTPPRNGYVQFQPTRAEENQSYITANAPFGTSNTKMDYGTWLRPVSSEANSSINNNNSSSAKKRANQPQSGYKNNPAGLPSWPGFLLTFDQRTQGARDTIQMIQIKLRQRGLRGMLQLIRSLLKQVEPNATIVKNGQFSVNEKQIYSCFQEIRIPVEHEQISEILNQSKNSSQKKKKRGLHDVELCTPQPPGITKRIQKEPDTGSLPIETGWQAASSERAQEQSYFASIVLQDRFFPVNHPDVIRQAKSEDEVLVEFIDTFDQHHQIYSDNYVVTLGEFEHYHWMISFLIEDDKHFEQIFKCYQLRKQY